MNKFKLKFASKAENIKLTLMSSITILAAGAIIYGIDSLVTMGTVKFFG